MDVVLKILWLTYARPLRLLTVFAHYSKKKELFLLIYLCTKHLMCVICVISMLCVCILFSVPSSGIITSVKADFFTNQMMTEVTHGNNVFVHVTIFPVYTEIHNISVFLYLLVIHVSFGSRTLLLCQAAISLTVSINP